MLVKPPLTRCDVFYGVLWCFNGWIDLSVKFSWFFEIQFFLLQPKESLLIFWSFGELFLTFLDLKKIQVEDNQKSLYISKINPQEIKFYPLTNLLINSLNLSNFPMLKNKKKIFSFYPPKAWTYTHKISRLVIH
jgi:hypothetical protein